MVTLDVVVPTYNRSALLLLTIDSLLRAPVPPGMSVTVIVVDNNSKDDTEAAVARVQVPAGAVLLRYVKETKQGLSQARNAGIRAGTGELIGFIDDDEQIGPEWYAVVAREFSDETNEYIGGPYLPEGDLELPSWVPPGYNGVLGIIPPKPRTRFGPKFAGNLQGGNAVFRRTVFELVGMYDVRLGRSGKGLLSEEDAELYRRLRDAGLRGHHVPDLVIFHHIPRSRMTRKYFRSWCYWRGVSHGIADKERPEKVAYSFGMPRYRIGQAIKGVTALPRNLSKTKGSGESFARELPIWDLAGFVYGKWFVNLEKLYGKNSG